MNDAKSEFQDVPERQNQKTGQKFVAGEELSVNGPAKNNTALKVLGQKMKIGIPKGDMLAGNAIAVIDSDPCVGLGLSDILSIEGYDVVYLRSAQAIANGFDAKNKQMALIDVGVGEKHLQQTIARHPDLLVIVLVAADQKETGLNYVRDGAYDYLEKPLKVDDVLATVGRGFEKIQLEFESHANSFSLAHQANDGETDPSGYQLTIPAGTLSTITHQIEDVAIELRNEIWKKPENSAILEPMLEKLIDLSDQIGSFGRQAVEENPSSFNLSDAIDSNLVQLHERLRYVGVEIISSVDPEIAINLPVRKEFDHAVTYLVSMAIKASDRGAPVYLGARKNTEGWLEIIFRDAGMTSYSENVVGEYCLMNGPAFRLMKTAGGFVSTVSELGIGSTTKLVFPPEVFSLSAGEKSALDTLTVQ